MRCGRPGPGNVGGHAMTIINTKSCGGVALSRHYSRTAHLMRGLERPRPLNKAHARKARCNLSCAREVNGIIPELLREILPFIQVVAPCHLLSSRCSLSLYRAFQVTFPSFLLELFSVHGATLLTCHATQLYSVKVLDRQSGRTLARDIN
jgi:hypothetical protein